MPYWVYFGAMYNNLLPERLQPLLTCSDSSFLLRDALLCKARSCDRMSSVRLFVRLSVTLVDHDHIGWKSWKLIAQTISPTSLLFVAQRLSTYSQGNVEKFLGENVHSTPTSIASDWIESTESRVIFSGAVAVCLHLSAHHVVIFAIAQLSCYLCKLKDLCWQLFVFYVLLHCLLNVTVLLFTL